MSNAQQYRAKVAEYTRLARQATFLWEIKEYHRRAEHFSALAESEEFVAASRDRMISNRAPAYGWIGHWVAEALTNYRNLMLPKERSAALIDEAPR
jgi:hypothetical protein